MQQQDYGTVGSKNWDTRPVVCLGGGPSLFPHKDKLWILFQKYHVIAVNDAYKYTYCPDAIITLDHTWLDENIKKIPDMWGDKVYAAVDEANPRIPCDNLVYLKRTRRNGLTDASPMSENPGNIRNGMNSGYAALNFSYLKGAKTIYLLGYDFKVLDDRMNFHSGYPWQKSKSAVTLFPHWAKAFRDTVDQFKAANIEVFNCSPDSLLDCFPYKPYSDIF